MPENTYPHVIVKCDVSSKKEVAAAYEQIKAKTGKIDIDRITTGVTASQRSNISIIKEIIKELEGQIGKQIPSDDIILKAKDKGMDPEKAESLLDVLKKEGVIFTPRAGFISRI